MVTKKQIRLAILKTLIYANIFDYPLTHDEIKTWLIECSDISLNQYLNKLKEKKLIKKIKKYYCLRGRENIINIRGKREHWATEKLNIAHKAASFLKLIPTIKLIGISGALAMNNTKIDDDIDFFIITSPNFLWTTRFLATILLDLKGVRRRPDDSEVSNKICLNMFIDENHLSILKDDRNIFSAHEVLQLKPIFEKNNTHQKFLSVNLWTKKYLPHAFVKKIKKQSKKSLGQAIFQFPNIFENFFKSIQIWYMKSRRTKEIIREGSLRFHPHDAKHWIINKYHNQLRLLPNNQV